MIGRILQMASAWVRAWRPVPMTARRWAPARAMYLVATALAAPVRRAPMAKTWTMATSAPVSAAYSENTRPALLSKMVVDETLTP